ncbi:Ribonuclease P/MRP protein subunit POP1 containing protein [Aphelenchoides besseyi]|nr:Ribonuclease P/MRP protein subunit POP1 containing protein [Aphelenchoides besseyi]
MMDALNDENPIPPLIDSLSLVNKRLKQVSDLVDVIHNGGRDHNPKTVIQRLPRHMRRRAMSHNIKRLPRRDRQFAVRVISKSNHKKKAPSRLRRRRPNNLRKEYERRESGEFRWLETHVWHAKRFEMTNLWNFKIPLRCYQRGVRPLIRKLDDGAVMFDDSYYRLLRFRFFTSDQTAIFQRNYAEIKNSTFQSLSEDRVSSSGIQVLFTIDEKQGGQTEVILSVHPLFYDNPLRLIERLCAGQIKEVTSKEELNVKLKERYNDRPPLRLFYGNDCQITDETNLFSFFTFYGSKTIQKLCSSIKLLANDEIDYEEFQSIHKKWKEFCDSNGTSTTLPNGTSFTLLARDPRLYSSFSRLAISSLPTTTSLPTIENPDEWAKTLQRSLLLFDPLKLNEFASASISEKRLNELKSQQLAPVKLRRYRVPVLISMWNWCSTNKVTMLLPSNASRHFFLNFYRSGFRVGSISDRFLLCNEIADCMYPFHWLPLTIPTKSYRWKRYHKFSPIDLSDFGQWNQLTNWTHLLDNPKRLANFQLLLDRPDIEIDVSQFQNTQKVLIPVRIIVHGKSDITDNDLIYEAFDPPIATKREEQEDKSASRSKTFGLFQEYKTLEVVNVSKMFDRTTIPGRQYKVVEKTISEEDLRHIIGRVVYSCSSLQRGQTEALGFVDLSYFPSLRSTRGKVLLRKPNGQKFSSATVRMLFC